MYFVKEIKMRRKKYDIYIKRKKIHYFRDRKNYYCDIRYWISILMYESTDEDIENLIESVDKIR
jgi:hypothetical protein